MKRILLALLCLLALSGTAQAAVCVRMDEGALLLDESGREIVPLGACDDIVSLGGGFFAAETDGLYALMDEKGITKTEAVYSDLRLQNGLLLACRDGLWGMMDAQGNEIGAFEYAQIVNDERGGIWAVKGGGGDLESEELYLLDSSGAEYTSGLMVRRLADGASGGLAAVMLPESGLWGYCSPAGEMAIPARYSYAGRFISERAAVVQDGFYGAIDADGDMIVPAEYDFLEISDAGFILGARTGAYVDLLDRDGNAVRRFEGEENFASAVGSGFILYDGRELLLCDGQGNIIETVDRQGNVFAGLGGQWIISEGAWGENCVRIAGTDVFRQNIYPLGMAEGAPLYAFMEADFARYVNDMLGEIQLAVDMESARYGVMDAQGVQIIPCEYESIEYLGNDRLLMRDGDYWQMTDSSGHIFWSFGIRQTEEPSF